MQFRIILALVALLIIAGSTAVAYRYKSLSREERGKRIVAELNLKTATAENNRLVTLTLDLQQQARVNDKIVLDLANRLAALREEQIQSAQELGDLKASTPDVKTFLDTPVPADLRRLLDRAVGIKDSTPAGHP